MQEEPRVKNLRIAKDTLHIIEKGFYVDLHGKRVEIKDDVEKAIKGSLLYKPTMTDKIQEELIKALEEREPQETIIEVLDITALGAIEQLSKEGYEKIAVLNFASGKKPGGGFLKGSNAQEESLARSSALYPCISQMKEMYEYNEKIRTCLYSDHLVYSPNVPVFKNDEGILYQKPLQASFVTAPAVNAGIVKQKEPQNVKEIASTMKRRIEKILSLNVIHNQEALILGAFGCGVFRNNPAEVAGYFKEALEDQRFKHSFKKVVFAVLDKSSAEEMIMPFKRVFM